jgi:hypothetical protein
MSPVTPVTPLLPTPSPFIRTRKDVQMHLISHGNTSTFGKSHARVRSRLSEAPALLRCRSFLEREQ